MQKTVFLKSKQRTISVLELQDGNIEVLLDGSLKNGKSFRDSEKQRQEFNEYVTKEMQAVKRITLKYLN